MSRIQNRIVFLSAVCALCAGAADIYTVTSTIPSGGIDLTALGDGYRQDAIAGQAAGANLPIAVTGRVVHASGLTPENPFIVSNAVSSSYFILKDADLVGQVPIRVVGAGTTYFPGTTLTNDGVSANGFFSAHAESQVDDLVVAGKRYLHFGPSAKSVKRVCHEAHEHTHSRNVLLSVDVVVERVNKLLKGWGGFYSVGYPSRAFRKVNHYVLKRMARFLNRKSQRYYRLKFADTYYGEMTHYGLHRLAWADVRRTRN